MLALSLDPDLRLSERPPPTRSPGEALIRVRMAGICNTDLEIVRGYMGFHGVLGHEFVGDVVEADDAAWLGARVNGEINLACGECEYCAQGLGRHCPTRSVLGILGKDGCFAEYVTLPVANLCRVPPDLSDESAVFTEPLAAAYEILEQVKVQSARRVLVVGDGKLGLLCALVLVGTGPEVSLVGKHPAKLAIAAARGVKTFARADAPSGWFDIVVEATGSPDGFKYAIERTRPRGTLVLKSTFHGDTPLATAPLVIHEITVVGSRCGPFMPAHAALASGLVEPGPMVHATLPLRDALHALARAGEPGVLKVLLDMRDGA
jgi:threonine dehydrogenase-like Zn-dependent dehydrogenase